MDVYALFNSCSLQSLGGWAPGSGGGTWPKPFLPALGAELCPDSATGGGSKCPSPGEGLPLHPAPEWDAHLRDL